MLFSDRLSKQKVLKSADRQLLLDTLIGDFRKAFPDLAFELQLDFAIINAQAIALGDKRIVAIYDGLALHPKLGPKHSLSLFFTKPDIISPRAAVRSATVLSHANARQIIGLYGQACRGLSHIVARRFTSANRVNKERQ